MKKTYLLLILISLPSQTKAADWNLGAELSNAHISGVRAYDADQNKNANVTDDLAVPSIFASRNLGEKFQLLARYSYYNSITASGISGNPDIFKEGKIVPQIVTFYDFSEKLHEGSFSFRYRILEKVLYSLYIGPTFSISYGETDFYLKPKPVFRGMHSNNSTPLTMQDASRKIRSFSSTDLTVGAEANISFKMTSRVDTALSYRFSNLSHRDVHLFGVSLALKL